MDDKAQKSKFQETLNLQRTDFSIRANAQIKEPEILKRWDDEHIAQKATEKNSGSKKFILHDGPPYANGHLHLGHALTYVLKDIVCKAKRMQGFHAPLVPGWDCHGLPIELKVTTERGLENNRDSVDRITFKKYCREYAEHWIQVQTKELKELGKLADFAHPYLTMSPSYESLTVRALAKFIEQGYIERKLKTVPWCASCQTVLATAEIEYKDRKDPSIYVQFPLPSQTARTIFPFLFEKKPDLHLSFLVWTTTPWTLPLNRAVVLNPSAVYAVLQGKTENQGIIVAKDLADKLCAQIGIEKIELAEADAVVFKGKQAEHPFIQGLQVPVLLDDSVLVSEGTACMHSAPGCGPEDYLLGIKNGLEIYSPLSDDGRYTKGILPTELEGKSIADGQGWVIQTLIDNGRLFHKASISHSYPHCWRCRNGLMFRATSQWFCDLQKNDLVKRSLEEIEKITFVPARGQARLHSFIANRSEWCISRQRQWGVPIPAILCNDCGWSFLSAEFVNNVADHVAKEGVEFWDRMAPIALVELGLLPKDFACGSCGNKNWGHFKLERDILDVWFDSGVSSYAVLSQEPKRLGVPADLYFEGSDQHRGWFQSSLLCGMIIFGHAPMRGIATHGFIVDEHKRKMSKSLGNVIAPGDIMTKYSRDILRLWVAGANFEDDLVISEKLLANVAEVYKKIRNTCRFMVANLYDFDITKDAVETNQMWAIDHYALATLHELDKKVRVCYDTYNFSGAVQAINNYCTNELSAVYLDILKDRLYVEKTDGLARRSAQTAIYNILDVLTRLLAPILSFLAEELSDFYQKGKQQSIHLQEFSPVLDIWDFLNQISKQGQWNMLVLLRAAVLKAIEPLREQGIIKHPYEAVVTLYVDPISDEGMLLKSFIQELEVREDKIRFFKDWLIVSNVTFVDHVQNLEQSGLPWLGVKIERAQGVKCPRCWQWTDSKHADGLCARCAMVVG